MSRECYLCGRHPMRGHEPGCEFAAGVPASHRPVEAEPPIALPGAEDDDVTADDEPALPPLPPGGRPWVYQQIYGRSPP